MSNEKNKSGWGGFFDTLRKNTILPADLLAGEFRLEVRGRNLVFLQGCRRILKYSPEEMILAAKGFKVAIRGEGLICSSYHGGTVSIEGRIRGVELLGGRGD